MLSINKKYYMLISYNYKKLIQKQKSAQLIKLYVDRKLAITYYEKAKV